MIAKIDPAEEYIRPAPKHLAMLAAEMRGWDYDDIRGALIACSEAGWTAGRIYREVFRLLLMEDSGPADLRAAARNPVRPVEAGPVGLPSSPAVVTLLQRGRERSGEATARFQAEARGRTRPQADPGDVA